MEVNDATPAIHIDICDNGSGIDPGLNGKLFEPFFTTRAKGTGLGLPIVKRILDQHHGQISLHANKSGGTCASVTLPIGPIES